MVIATILLTLAYVFRKRFKPKTRIPNNIVSKFQAQYPYAENVEWFAHAQKDASLKGHEFEAYFVTDEIRRSVWYNQQGEIIA